MTVAFKMTLVPLKVQVPIRLQGTVTNLHEEETEEPTVIHLVRGEVTIVIKV